jgi:tRNA nucleotidyltransferase (CCA-adding enzyme)
VQAHDLAVGWSSPSEAVAALDAVTELAVVTAWVLNEAHPQLHRYLAEWRFVRAATTGDDLIALGLAPGPKFKEILWKARAARLDGGISDAAGERALVRRFLDESRA